MVTMASGNRYTFDNSSSHTTEQMGALVDILDSTTFRHLSSLGDLTGARCLEVGAGAGSVAAWLAEKVGSAGHVTATDIDPVRLTHLAHLGNVTVLRHDMRAEPPPEPPYDLVHARLVLIHIPERRVVLDALTKSLRPGGWIVMTEWECTVDGLVLDSAEPSDAEVFTRYNEALLAVGAANGADVAWAREVLPAMRALGLEDVTTHVDCRSWPGGSAGCLLHWSNSHQLEAQLVATGLAPVDLERVRELLSDPQFVLQGYLTRTTIGRARGFPARP